MQTQLTLHRNIHGKFFWYNIHTDSTGEPGRGCASFSTSGSIVKIFAGHKTVAI